MAKYYVQCGPVKMVLAAESMEDAALVAIGRALQSQLWIYDDSGLSDRDRHDHLMLEALLQLAPSIEVSEQGFGRHDASVVGTPEAVEQWHDLMVATSRLLAAMSSTGSQPVPPRSVSSAGQSACPFHDEDRCQDWSGSLRGRRPR